MRCYHMAINGTTLRMTGLYSGIDTDALVKSMMQIEQLKLDRHTRALTTLQWKQESYNAVTADLKTFMNDYTSVLGANSMMKSGNYVAFTAKVSGANADAVTAAGTSSAYAGSVKIGWIEQLAEASKASSSAKVSAGDELAVSNSTALKDLDFAKALQFENGEISFSVNGEKFTFSQNDTLQTVINKVNASDAGVNMVYSRLTDTISFTAKESGADGSVEIRNLKGNAFGSEGAFGIDNGIYGGGKNAILHIDGVKVEKSSNSFTLDGISYTLNHTTNEDDAPITITLEQDVSAALDHVKKFVEGYNTLINKLTELVSSRKAREERNYTPLTKEEKSSMTDEQIKQWEDIAKKGLLYNDAGVQGLLSNLRSALYDTITSAGLSMSDIGFRTGDYTKGGQISLDEDRLRAALERNPHQVMSAFMNISGSADSSTAYAENGLLLRINNLMNSYIKGSGQMSLNTLEGSMFKASKRISEMESKMLDLEERYYMKYAALEEMMSMMDSQSNWLSTMLGSMTAK